MFAFLFSLSSFAMPFSDFQLLKNQIQDASYSSDKQSLIEMAKQRSTFTCDQIKVLLSLIAHESDQLTALRSLAPQIEDPERSFTILEAFKYSSGREDAKAIIDEYAPEESKKQIRDAQREKEKMEQEARIKAEIEQREREARIREESHMRDDGPLLQWLGRCSKTKDSCLRFDPTLFSPLSSVSTTHHKRPAHELLLEISGPGVVQITANMGKKYSCRKNDIQKRSDPLRLKKEISLSEGRNLINLSELIPDWQREYAEIKVEKGFMTSIIRLDDWNRCP